MGSDHKRHAANYEAALRGPNFKAELLALCDKFPDISAESKAKAAEVVAAERRHVEVPFACEDIRIDAEEYEAARRDPRVRAFHAAAEEYANGLVERGHCRCHLVVNCPAGPST